MSRATPDVAPGSSRPPALRQLELHLTRRCNLRCSYCYASAGFGREDDLCPEHLDLAIERLLASPSSARTLKLELWGGEPFLRPDLVERAARRARLGAQRSGRALRIAAPTNLTLLDERALDLVFRWDIELSLSLDGGAEAMAHRRLPSGESAWPLVERALLRVVERCRSAQRPLPPARMTVVPQRAAHLAADIDALLARGVRVLHVLPASGVEWKEAATRALDASLAQVGDQLIAWLRAGTPAPPVYPHLLRRLARLSLREAIGHVPDLRGYCGAGESLLAVACDGSLYPCHRIAGQPSPPASLRLGHVATPGLDPAVLALIGRLDARSPELRCGRCPARATCGALCLAFNVARTGDPLGVPDEACWLGRRLSRAAARLHAAGRDLPAYQRYVDAFARSDPDERAAPLLAALERSPDVVARRVEALLGGLGGER